MQGALKSVLLIVSAVAFYCSVFGCVDSGFRGIHNLGKEGNDGGTSLWQETFFPQEDQFWMLCPAFSGVMCFLLWTHFECTHCYGLLAVCPWTNDLTSLGFSFLICKRVIKAPVF